MARQALGPEGTLGRSVILATTDGGRTWAQQYPPANGAAATPPASASVTPSTALPPAFRVTGAWFADATTGWVTGQRCQEQPQPTPGANGRATPVPPVCAGLIEATTDGGRTWQRQYATADVLGPTQFVSTTTGWAVRWHGTSCVAAGSPCASVLMGTDDGGRHWRDLSTTPLRLVQLAFTGASQGWLLALRCGDANQVGACAAHVLVTADGGRAWRDTALPLQARNADLSHPTATDGWVAASLGAPGQPALIASRDSGRTWQPLPNPGSSFEQHVFFRDAKQGWLLAGGEPGAGAQMKELFQTTDGGHTWTRLAWTGGFGEPGSIGTGGLPAGGYVGQVVFPTAQDGWIASPRGSLLHSADGGKTWRPAAIDAHFFSAVGFASPQLGWAVSVAGPAVWLTDDAGRTWCAVALPQG